MNLWPKRRFAQIYELERTDHYRLGWFSSFFFRAAYAKTPKERVLPTGQEFQNYETEDLPLLIPSVLMTLMRRGWQR